MPERPLSLNPIPRLEAECALAELKLAPLAPISAKNVYSTRAGIVRDSGITMHNMGEHD